MQWSTKYKVLFWWYKDFIYIFYRVILDYRSIDSIEGSIEHLTDAWLKGPDAKVQDLL